MSPVTYASAGSNGGISASSRISRSSSSDSVIAPISRTNGLDVNAASSVMLGSQSFWGSQSFGGHSLGGLLLHEPEQVARHPPHLDLLAALGDPVAPMVTVDVL